MKTLSNIIMKLATGTFIVLVLSASITPVQADSNAWEPRGIFAVWANGRGPAHLEFLRNDYQNHTPSVSQAITGQTHGTDAIWRNAHSHTLRKNSVSKSDISLAN